MQEKGWKNGVLKIRAGFLLRKMMNGHVVVAVGEAGESFNGMICLNEAGVFLWQQMEKGIEKSALIGKVRGFGAKHRGRGFAGVSANGEFCNGK